MTGDTAEALQAGRPEEWSGVLVARTRGELSTGLAALRGPRHAEQEQGGQEQCRGQGHSPSIALVPTMGALHAGHTALIRRGRELADATVVSIFVNPLQFGPGEDYERYPRSFGADVAACREEGAALVFSPPREVVYPQDPVVRVSAGEAGHRLEGASRPGHFDGVLTVVLKLLELVRPDVAVFGEKDAQQLALIRRMARDLEIPVRIASVPTVREQDGLAVSSRNTYLSGAQRRSALALSRALRAGEAAAAEGRAAVLAAASEVLASEPGLELDYLALVDPDTFTEAGPGYTGPATLAVAAEIGGVRLIDNLPITVAPEQP